MIIEISVFYSWCLYFCSIMMIIYDYCSTLFSISHVIHLDDGLMILDFAF